VKIIKPPLNPLGVASGSGRKVLLLLRNNFSGSISPLLSLSSGLQRFNLSHNSLSGSIPISFVNMSSCRFLDLSENSFSCPLPDNLFQDYFSFSYLSLARNTLEGQIPITLSRCSLLNNLNLSNNRFSDSPDFASRIWSLKGSGLWIFPTMRSV
jgi:Leucine-rich repeat (LRR) protein